MFWLNSCRDRVVLDVLYFGLFASIVSGIYHLIATMAARLKPGILKGALAFMIPDDQLINLLARYTPDVMKFTYV